jgi:hypothetical protein
VLPDVLPGMGADVLTRVLAGKAMALDVVDVLLDVVDVLFAILGHCFSSHCCRIA